MKMKTKLTTAVALALVAGASFAQGATGPDVSEIVTVIKGCGVAVAAIGIAALAIHFGAKVYKWIKGAA